MHLPTLKKTAYAARQTGDYQRIESALRAARSLRLLRMVWAGEHHVISRWPREWVERITEEKERLKGELS